MKSRLRNALVGVTALGMTGIGYVGGKEGLKLVTYPDIVGVWVGCYGETRGNA
jgi:lysozyme